MIPDQTAAPNRHFVCNIGYFNNISRREEQTTKVVTDGLSVNTYNANIFAF